MKDRRENAVGAFLIMVGLAAVYLTHVIEDNPTAAAIYFATFLWWTWGP